VALDIVAEDRYVVRKRRCRLRDCDTGRSTHLISTLFIDWCRITTSGATSWTVTSYPGNGVKNEYSRARHGGKK
jgi:hypothetical protein